MDFTPKEILLDRVKRLYHSKVSPFIGIDGFCGSGKSTIAATLKKELELFKIKTLIISTDYFIKPKRFRKVYASVFDYDYKRLRDEVLVPLKASKKAKTRFYIWEDDAFKEVALSSSGRVVIFEGVNSVNPLTKEFYDFTVFINTTKELADKRVIKRGDFTKGELAYWQKSEKELFMDRDIDKYYDFVYNSG